MKTIAAYCLAIFSTACSISGSSHVHLTFGEGASDIYSKVRVRDGVAHFRCIESGTGQCHYTVYSAVCDTADDRGDSNCPQEPLTRFTIGKGETLEMKATESLRPCVRPDTVLPDRECGTPELSAVR